MIVVPARIEEEAGAAELLRCQYEFVRRFTHQNFAAAELITTDEAMWALRIPEAPATAVLDSLPVRLPPPERHLGLYRAYRLLLEALTQRSTAHSRLRTFVKIHVLQKQQTSAAQTGTASSHGLHDPYRLPLEALVKTCTEVYLRPTPGYVSKPLHEALRLDTGVYAKIVDGPQVVDGLRWWMILCKSTDAIPMAPVSVAAYPDQRTPVLRGWVAETTPSGVAQLQRVDLEFLNPETRFCLLDER